LTTSPTTTSSFKIIYFNINHISYKKILFTLELLDSHTIVIVAETHMGTNSYNVPNEIKTFQSIRLSKLGGGLICFTLSDSRLCTKILHSNNEDILLLQVKFNTIRFKIATTYWTVNKNGKYSALNNIIAKDLIDIYKRNTNEKFIVIGDFNAHLDLLEDCRTDHNGEILLNLLNENDFILGNTQDFCSGTMTWSRGKFSHAIDYIFYNSPCSGYINNIQISDKPASPKTDHHMFTIEIHVTSQSQKKKQKGSISFINFKNQEKICNYMMSTIDDIHDKAPQNFDDLNRILKQNTNRYLCSRRKVSHLKSSLPVELKALITKKKNISKRIKAEKSEIIRENLWQDYKKSLNDLNQELTRHQCKLDSDIVSQIKIDKNRNMWHNIRKLRKTAAPKFSVVDKDNAPLDNDRKNEEITNFWSTLGNKQDNHFDPSSIDESTGTYFNPNYDHCYFKRNFTVWEDEAFTLQEIISILNDLKGNKAPGPDNLHAENYKTLSNNPVFLNCLLQCMNNALISPPSNWQENNIVLIPKIANQQIKCDQFRPICLSNLSYKIFATGIKMKLLRFFKNNAILEEEQAAFLPRRRMEEQILIIQLLVSKAEMDRKPLYCLTLDIKKAFDSVSRTALLTKLVDLNFNPKFIRVLAKIYEPENCHLFLNSSEIGSFKKERGIKQGCPVSPVLFNLIMNDITLNLNKYFPTNVDEYNILLFADDILLLADSRNDALSKLNITIDTLSKHGLTIHPDKSSFTVFNHYDDRNIDFLRHMDSFKYLGINITSRPHRCPFKCNIHPPALSLDEHISKKLLTADKFKFQARHYCHNHICQGLIGRTLWKNVFLPIILHGFSAINISQKQMDQLDKIQAQYMKAITRMPQRTSNLYMQSELGYSSSISRDRKMKLLFLRHILNNCNKLSHLTHYMWNTNNSWIAKCKFYLSQIDMDLETLSLTPKNSLIQTLDVLDMNKWREAAHNKASLKYYAPFITRFKNGSDWLNSNEVRIGHLFDSGSILYKNKTAKFYSDCLCPTCAQPESLEHIIFMCNAYSDLRAKYNIASHSNIQVFFETRSSDKEFRTISNQFLTKVFNRRFS